jgi:regulator of RNase E activity RraB
MCRTHVLLAYDVLVTAACQELTPFWGKVYDDNNDKDNEDNNDNEDDNDRRWQRQQ